MCRQEENANLYVDSTQKIRSSLVKLDHGNHMIKTWQNKNIFTLIAMKTSADFFTQKNDDVYRNHIYITYNSYIYLIYPHVGMLPHYWPLWGEPTGDHLIPLASGINAESISKRLHDLERLAMSTFLFSKTNCCKRRGVSNVCYHKQNRPKISRYCLLMPEAPEWNVNTI